MEGFGMTETSVAWGRGSSGSIYGMVPYSVIEWHTVIEDLTGFAKEADFMARIPDEEIERLKKEIPLERLAEARGGC